MESSLSTIICLDSINNSNQHRDIVHDNSLIITIPLMIISRIEGVKIRILHSHATKLGETTSKEKRNRMFVPLLLKNCNRYVACSEAAGKSMFGRKPFVVLPNVVNDTAYSLSDHNRRLTREKNLVTDKTVIVTVGRACEQKNPIFALKVMKSVMERNPKAVYWWVGDGPMLDQMRNIAENYGMSQKVIFWGKQSDVKRLYEAADVFFLPSLFEGLPLTGIEAQAMGLPSVVSETVTKEMVFTNLVEYVSLEEPIEKWVRVLEKQAERIPERRSYTQELKKSNFSYSQAGEKLEKYYRELLE